MMKSNDMKTIPYVQIDGVWTFRDSSMAGIYYRIMDESPHVFKDGSINTLQDFLNEFKHSTGTQVFVSVVDEDPVGIIWFNRFQHTFAQGHFCFFKKYWGDPVVIEAAERTLRMFFKYCNCESAIGITPASNKKALGFLKRLGARTVGIILNGYPNKESGEVEEAVVSQFMRSDYEE